MRISDAGSDGCGVTRPGVSGSANCAGSRIMSPTFVVTSRLKTMESTGFGRSETGARYRACQRMGGRGSGRMVCSN